MSRITINSNNLSLNAQRYFNRHTKGLENSFTRLSSGLRINKASDDSAGLSVASLLNVDSRISLQGIRNINDGVSYLNVAESALSELSNIVIRIQELAQQGANGTLGSQQREALQQEVTSLQSEYNRIVRSTKFNGNTLLTGITTKTSLQGGFGIEGQLNVQIGRAALAGNTNLDAGGVVRVNISATGVEANGATFLRGMSADGRFVALGSAATNLVSGDLNGQSDAFIKDLLTGEIKLVSTSSSGVQGNGLSGPNNISADGRYVGFISLATNLAGVSDTNGAYDAFVKDTLTDQTILVSSSSSGTIGNSSSYIRAFSGDNRHILFHSDATNLVAGDTNGVSDVFVKDLQTNQTTLVSTGASGQGNGSSVSAGISADGRYVLFRSDATNLVVGDTNGATDSFVKDLVTGVITIVSTNSSGVQGNGTSNAQNISADGRYVIFDSSATNLVSSDTNGVQDSFVKNLLTGEVINVNTDSNGNQGNGSSDVTGISSDGRYVTFRSNASNLVANDTNGFQDVFIKDLFTNETRLVSVNTDGVGGNAASTVSYVSNDGKFVAFDSSASNLVSGDTNGVMDSFIRDLSKAGIREIAGMVVSNQGSARVTIELAKKYQEEISTHKAGIGSALSRASTFVSVLQSASENYISAASQITDVDVAEETTNLTRNQILQQAATSVLAQANLQPRIALQLLEDV